jgi:predicted esterase
VDLRRREAHSQRVEQLPELRLVDFSVGVLVDALEAVAKRVTGHGASLRRLANGRKRAVLAALCLASCHGAPEADALRPPAPTSTPAPPSTPAAAPAPLHPSAESTAASDTSRLTPLQGDWLIELKEEGATPVFVAPPLGATAPRPFVLGVHGAGDRPEWSCGGWRLASQASAFVVCPQGRPMNRDKLAWASATELSERAERAVALARRRYAPYLDDGPSIFAGFSQGATLAEPFLRKNAARFRIAILAEGGYAIAQSPTFAAAYRAGGGRRVVLVCGNPGCFATAKNAQRTLERAGLQVLVVGDPAAGHNLNERMQKSLQAAWTDIAAPLPAD